MELHLIVRKKCIPTETVHHFGADVRPVLDSYARSLGELQQMEEWRPATVEEVKNIIEKDLRACDAEQIAVFNRYVIEPYAAPMVRYGNMESAVVVARKGNEVIYWEDVEDGFNVSPVDSNGQ